MSYGLQNLLTNKNVLAPFHAPLIFFDNANIISYIYCYFCPDHRFYPSSFTASIEDTLNLYTHVIGLGYGRSVIFETPLTLPFNPPEFCFNIYKHDRDKLEILLKVLKLCSDIELITISSVQGFLNISLLSDKMLDPWESFTYKWFIYFMIAESYLQSISTDITELRAQVNTSQYDQHEYIIACTTLHDLSSIDYSFITVVKYESWVIFLGMVLMYGFLWKNFFKGLDLMFHFFGIAC